ncbi:AsmA-like C-terminal region-containing protein [Hymenobacter sp.]|uniref:AsmA-like C-terminal region-containing protein n=1 Tax=Hymenobacter sp. TaxID=1898978 RepID=UPI00286A14A3|nr:AsmA-like C-terminal region-containing protein [Hymenobacter sp.]
MKSFPLRRILVAVLLLGVLGLGAAAWWLGSAYGQRQVAQLVRRALTHDSELVLAPFAVELSPWRDFPHLTASIQHVALTDTSYRQRVPVLRVGRADLRVALRSLLRGRVQVTRLVVTDVDFRERTDSLGRSWGLRGKRRKGTGTAPALNLELEELLVNNFRMSAHNAYSRSAFGARVRAARLRARLRGGELRVAGTLDGELSYLRTRAGSLFEREPVRARVHYSYLFGKRQGRLWGTRATLNGDTIRVSGTHTVDASQPRGTRLDLRFVGNQPLTKVLRAALPPRLEPFLDGATSPSRAHIHYTITGLSGPKVSPRNVLTFGLRGARLQWPAAARRINRWDLQGTYDNGPAHNVKSTVLTLTRCRVYSPAGQLDVALTLRDFARPYVDGRFRGRTELPNLATVVAPGRWRVRHGIADVDVRLRGLLKPMASRANPLPPFQSLSARGTVTLRDASFVMPAREADMSELNVRLGLQDSLLTLSNASGVLDGMRFRASARTTHLFDYLTGQHATTRISGAFAVDELRVARLRALLQPVPRTAGPGFSPASLPKPAPARRDRAQLAATLGSELIPPGLLLDVGLRCKRLLLATDTLSDLAVTVRHDGRRVQLLDLAGGVWGGAVRGSVAWPTDPANRVAPVQYQLGVRFATLDYRQFLARLTEPEPRAARRAKAKGAASPALRDLLLTANGQVNIDIDRVLLPDAETLDQVSLRLEKAGSVLHLPYLRFRTPEGGQGEATATVQVENLRFVAGAADVTLRYATLDVQRLLALIASLTPPPDSVPTARTQARVARRATRRALRQQAPQNTSVLAQGGLRAVLRVEADQVRYAAIRGSRLRLVSHLRDGEARLDNCTLDALQGRISLRGRMLSTADRGHHPAQAQVQLDDIQLPALFATATAMGLRVLGSDNIRGTLRGVADLRTDLDAAFLPKLGRTTGFLQTEVRNLELLNVDALMEALRFMKAKRTSHLYFEPVRSEFVLTQGELLIPDLRLNSNLSNLAISGRYGLDGPSNLFIGLKPWQALFGNNAKRIERIQNGEPVSTGKGGLTYLNLRRNAPGERYKVRLFQQAEQRAEQASLREQCRALQLAQRPDTTARVLAPARAGLPTTR